MITTRLPAQSTPQKKGRQNKKLVFPLQFFAPLEINLCFFTPRLLRICSAGFCGEGKMDSWPIKKHGLGGICDVKHLID